jgi:hypothetical protein
MELNANRMVFLERRGERERERERERDKLSQSRLSL